jgi:SSS family solute:Na+ symporter
LGIERDGDGRRLGKGALNLELLLLNALGLDLARNPYALNETLRISFRIVAAFLMMISVSLLAARDEGPRVDRFYAKMRTKVHSDPEIDAKELALSLEDVHRHEDLLLLPGTDWELFKWNREDIVGFAASIAAVFGILLLMVFLIGLGG